MAEEVRSETQHLARLDFDISGVEQSFAALNELAKKEAVTLKDLLDSDMDVGKMLKSKILAHTPDGLDAAFETLAQNIGTGVKRVSEDVVSDLRTILKAGYTATMVVTKEQKTLLDKEIEGWNFGNKLRMKVVETQEDVQRALGGVGGLGYDALNANNGDEVSDAITRTLTANNGGEIKEQMELYQAEITLLKQLQVMRRAMADGTDESVQTVATDKAQTAMAKFILTLQTLREQYGDGAIDSIFHSIGMGEDDIAAAAEKAAQSVGSLNRSVNEAENSMTFQSGKSGFDAEFFTDYVHAVEKVTGTMAVIRVDANDAGEVTRANVTYTDAWGRSLRETYGWVTQAKEEGEETEQVFRRISQTAVDDYVGRASKKTRELAAEARAFGNEWDAAMRTVNTTGAFAASHADSGLGYEAQALRQNLEQVKAQMDAVNDKFTLNGAKIAEVTGADRARLAVLKQQAAALSTEVSARTSAAVQTKNETAEQKKHTAEVTKTAALYKQVLELQRKGAAVDGADGGTREKLTLLREQLSDMISLTAREDTLDEKQKERLKTLREQLSTMQEQVAVLRTQAAEADTAPSLTMDSEDDSTLARSGKWFGAYKLWHLAEQGVRATASAVVDAEDAMAEISRAMNDAGYDADAYRVRLYELGQQYGQSFGDMAAVAAKWVKAGYDVNESLSATESTVLALATADMDAESATTDLIAIMKQWSFTVDDLEGIIDRINIVSNNFPVEAQDIVDALEKVGTAAKNAGMSFNDTIAVTTTMMASMGASGTATGNALRAMISIMTREANLSTLEGLGVDIYKDKETGTMNGFTDILESMARVWQEASAKQKDAMEDQMDTLGLYNTELADAMGLTDEYAQNIETTTTAQRNMTAAVANTYRSNYFQALLGNEGMIEEVNGYLGQADGSARKELTVYLETLTAHLTTLKAALEELAVTSAENGLTDLAAGFMDAAAAVANLINRTGGLVPVLSVILGLVVALNAQKTVSTITSVSGALARLIPALVNVARELYAAHAAGTLFNASAATLMGGLGLAVAAVGAAVGAFRLLSDALDDTTEAQNAYNEAVKEIETTRDSAIDGAYELKGYADALRALADSGEKSGDTLSMMDYYIGKLNGSLDGANLKYNALTGSVDGLNESLYESVDALIAQAQAEANAATLAASKTAADAAEREQRKAQEARNAAQSAFDAWRAGHPTDAATSNEAIALSQATDALAKRTREAEKALAAYNELYSALVPRETSPLTDDVWTDEPWEELADGMENAAEAADAFRVSFAKMAMVTDGTDSVLSQAETNLGKLEKALAALSDGGAVSFSDVFDLIEKMPELAKSIGMENDELTVNAQSWEEVRQAQYAIIEQSAAAALYNELLAQGMNEEALALEELAYRLSTATGATEQQAAATALYDYAVSVGAEKTDAFAAALVRLGGYIKESKTDASALASGLTSEANAQKTAAEEKIKALKKEKEAAQDSYKAQIDALKKLKEEYSRSDDAEDYESQRAEYVKQLEEAKKRSSQDAVSDVADLEQKIADLDRDYARKTRDNGIDDQITALEDAKDESDRYYDAQIEHYTEVKTAAEKAALGVNALVYDTALNVLDTTRLTAEQLSEYIDALAQKLVETYGGVYDTYRRMLEQMAADGRNLAAYSMQQLSMMAQQVQTVTDAMRVLDSSVASVSAKADAQQTLRDAWGNSKTATKNYLSGGLLSGIRSSHSGSTVSKDGLVNLQAGEIVLNSDASRILSDIAPRLAQMVRDTTPLSANAALLAQSGSYVDAAHRAAGGVTNRGSEDTSRRVEFNAPLFNVENQTVTDDLDMELVARKVTRILKRELV